MKTGRRKPTLQLTTEEKAQLKSPVGSRSFPHAIGTGARLIRLSHEGLKNAVIAARVGLTQAPVGKWRQRSLLRGEVAGHRWPLPQPAQ